MNRVNNGYRIAHLGASGVASVSPVQSMICRGCKSAQWPCICCRQIPMKKCKAVFNTYVLYLGFLIGVVGVAPAESSRAEQAEIDRVAAFAKVYGYVRFFHPSDQAAQIDWVAMAVEGVRQSRQSTNLSNVECLRQIFAPLAPRVEFASTSTDFAPAISETGPRTYWQHCGVHLYKILVSRRVLTGAKTGDRVALFDADPGENAEIVKEVGPGTWIRLPLSLSVDPSGATLPAATSEFYALKERLSVVDTSPIPFPIPTRESREQSSYGM